MKEWQRILMSKFAQNLEIIKHICANSFTQPCKEMKEKGREKARARER